MLLRQRRVEGETTRKVSEQLDYLVAWMPSQDIKWHWEGNSDIREDTGFSPHVISVVLCMVTLLSYSSFLFFLKIN